MDKIFWLKGFKGTSKIGYKRGAYYRSKIAIDINDFETKFNKKVVGIGIANDIQSGNPSWNVEFIIETKYVTPQDDEALTWEELKGLVEAPNTADGNE